MSGEMADNGDLSNERKRWSEATYAKARERGGERKDTDFRTSSAEVQPLYTPEDVADIDYKREVGYPGEYPYTRGVQATDVSRAALVDPSVRRLRHRRGDERALQVPAEKKASRASPSPSTCPLSSATTPTTRCPSARSGRSASRSTRWRDMETMFEGIPLDQVSTSMTINAPASVLVAMYAVVGREAGRPAGPRLGAPRRTTCSRSTSRAGRTSTRRSRRSASPPTSCRTAPASCRGSTRSASAAITCARPAARRLRRWRSPSPTPSPTSRLRWREASASTTSRRASLGSSTRRTTSSRRSRSTARSAGCGRRSCASASTPRTRARWMLRTHVQTGGATLTAQQPENNIVRAALQALATMLGGVQSLALSCYDEALALPTEEAQRIAVRTQQVIAYESGVDEYGRPTRRLVLHRVANERARAQGVGVSRARSRTWAVR